MNTAYENSSLRNPKPELLDKTHTAGRNNSLDGLIRSMPSLNTVSVETDCQIHGKQSWLVTKIVDNAHNIECQKCKWERDAYQNKVQNMQADLLASLEIPSEHINADFSQWSVGGDDQIRARIANIVNFSKEYAASYRKGHANILLTGNTGTGKTKLACLIANEIVRQCYYAQMTVAFKRSGQIQQEIKATWDKGSSDNDTAYIERLSRSTVLIIDEVGEADTSFSDKAADKDRERLSAIIDRRYQLRLPTIITTNMTADEFYHQMGDRASDRLRQNLVDISCVWPSYRILTGKVRSL
ncbi:ATP-binding protein [Psychrobacter fozii]|uniref:DNA replication protein DnaC n=1 Tax=Psychrobacter fozii TaxID=198480 RepID=A0A2V4UH09_9GAMM|nr:ATP-binding protein [Psychrobacter fozii]PYE38099.1 DNA replication protein DnaC [Psychrobacter fozii]